LIAIHELKPLAIGMDPFQVETISQRLVRDVYSEGAQIHMCAVAAIEIALWDIIPVGRPVPRKTARLCTPESFGAKAKQVAARGYTALQFDPFGSS